MSQPSVLFLGATGGCVNACLTQTIKSGTHKATALVRTPDKLTKMLQDQQKLTPDELSNLNILSGNALDLGAVKSAITASRPDVILTGLGVVPKFNMRHPLTFGDEGWDTLCTNASKILVTAVGELGLAKKPHLVFISTTGISRGVEDVPFGMQTLYHSLLKTPHIDKKGMENEFRGQVAGTLFASITGIRPTLLTGAGVLGEGVGVEKVRAGTENEPQKGFTIARADVGTFIWENVVKDGPRANGRSWRGEMISLAC